MSFLLHNEHNPPPLLKPNAEDIDRLRSEIPSIFRGEACGTGKGRYDFNELHLPDYLWNWSSLDWITQRLVQEFTRASWLNSHFRKGLKSPLIPGEHALLMIGSGIHDTEASGRSGTGLVRSMFMNAAGEYIYPPCNLRQFGPRSARRYSKGLVSSRNFDQLLEQSPAVHVIINAPRSIQLVGEDPFHHVDGYRSFFKEACHMLECWSRRKAIHAVLGSCEISCTSIIDGRFHPHVHAIIWTELNEEERRKLAPDWSIKWGSLITERERLDEKIHYIFKAYGLSDIYRRELERDNPDRQEFNRRTINAWSSLRRLRPSRGVRILNIPKRPAQ